MNFEKVEIYGFKSFADKVEIKFGNGITGIVGPNGCGKSNVADAIRWVLGEQSPKALRGSSMQDVIFSGTQNRKSLSYCEVSLFFDNSNKIFSIDYNEVIITRKLFKSGESEYYINKQPARLKDIVELLHECGIGKEGYSIIGQGKVEEIMSAKPEDRRMIFEEATGIAKFKTRKNETERKLERSHENLIRHIDIITEIETQLGPLEKQAEKAKEYNELSEELKFHELNTYVSKVENVETSKNKIYTRIKGLDENAAICEKRLTDAQKEYDKIFSDMGAADDTLKTLNERLTENLVSMERNSGEKRLFEQRISYLTGQIERAENEIKENDAVIEDCKESFGKNSAELERTKTELEEESKKAEKLAARLTVLNEKISLGEELEKSNRKMVIESIENLTDAKVSEGTMSIERINLNEKKNELTEKLDALSVKREALFTEKEKSDAEINELDRAVSELKNKIIEQENAVRDNNEKVAEIDNKIYSLNTVVASLTTRGNFYRQMRENYEGFSDAVKILLNKAKENSELKKRIKGVVAELIKSDKKFDIALETALGNAAQNIVTANTDDAKYLIEYLKANKYGRITFLPISSVKEREKSAQITLSLREKGAIGAADEIIEYSPEYDNIISNLLGNTLIVDNLENARNIAEKYRFAFKIVTLDGDVFSTQGSMTGGSKRQDAIGVLSGERRVEETEKELKVRQNEMDDLKAKKHAAEKERDQSLDDLSVVNDMYDGKRQQSAAAREKLTATENSLIEVGKEMENVSDLIEEIDKRIARLEEEFVSVSSGGKELEERRKGAKKRADEHEAEFEELKKNRDKVSEEFTAVQIKITELKGRAAQITDDNARLSQAIIEAEKSNVDLNRSNDGAREIIETIKRDREKITLTKNEQDVINGIRVKIADVEKQKSDLKLKLDENDAKKQSITDELNAITEKKHAEEIAITKIDSDLEYLGQSVFEDYNETYETAVKLRAPDYDVINGEKEIARIRKRRSSLGAINAAAIDDFKLLKERYDEKMAEKEDIEKAEADLRQAIEKIKAEMLTQFDEGFKKINENFQRIFKELFGGGKAMLELDYSENPDKLEAGVEIIAEPPGKKLQKLSLLSGGEKALTAIAILFSILKMRPMPFCVLDEIEAALDEANVDRFARYLQKFSEETQFIVITHRKPTMEMADSLFGVTMEEKGVSKMVSVKLSDVAAFDDQIA